MTAYRGSFSRILFAVLTLSLILFTISYNGRPNKSMRLKQNQVRKASKHQFDSLRKMQKLKFANLRRMCTEEGKDIDVNIVGGSGNFISKNRGKSMTMEFTNVAGIADKFRIAFMTRTMAEPKFTHRFLGELILAATLQTLAEYQRRGGNFLHEIDYVIAGVLVAILGKGLAAFRSAPSLGAGVLTNGFQFGDYSLKERLLAIFVTPTPRLFISGVFAGGLGYTISRGLTRLRMSQLGSAAVSAVPAVPILAAAGYTGCFLVLVSGPSYQILSGLIEQRYIDRYVTNNRLSRFLVSIMRILRSLFASALAIRGMQLFGLQR